MNQLTGTGIDFPSPEQPSTLAAELAALGIYPPLFSLKETDQSVTNSTTLVDCEGLRLPLEANSTYLIDLSLLASDGGGQVLAKVVVPSGAESLGRWVTYSGEDSKFDSSAYLHTTQEIVFLNDSTDVKAVKQSFLVKTGSTAGDIKMQFAQAYSNAVATITKSGSWIKAQKL